MLYKYQNKKNNSGRESSKTRKKKQNLQVVSQSFQTLNSLLNPLKKDGFGISLTWKEKYMSQCSDCKKWLYSPCGTVSPLGNFGQNGILLEQF